MANPSPLFQTVCFIFPFLFPRRGARPKLAFFMVVFFNHEQYFSGFRFSIKNELKSYKIIYFSGE